MGESRLASGLLYRPTGIARSQLWRAGFPNYRAAVEAAGLTPNVLNAATDTSYEAFFRLSGQQFAALSAKLLDYCRSRNELADVADLLGEEDAKPTIPSAAQRRLQRVVGYVYLAKHGRDYKIGRSNDVTRRRREISLLLPNELEHVHVIETDDPEGIEAYWHRRFEKRRSRGEWFRLTPDDLAAFRRRRYPIVAARRLTSACCRRRPVKS
jgi:hypothetical protein